MKITHLPTNNFIPGRKKPVKYGVIHYVNLKEKFNSEKYFYNIDSILSYLGEPGIESYHYVISRDGEIYSMVADKDTASHCGESVISIPTYSLRVDEYSIGVALVGSETTAYTSKQYSALAWLASHIETNVIANRIGFIEHWVGHDWVSGELAHKFEVRHFPVKDPGDNFDWEIFNRERYRNKLLVELESEWKSKLVREIEDSLSFFYFLKKAICRLFQLRKS